MRKSAILVFLLAPFASLAGVIPLSPKNCDPVSDSILIHVYIDSLNKQFTADDRASYTDGTFDYAPGNYFKIMSLRGQECGMQCNALEATYVFYENENGLKVDEFGMSPIDNITELNCELPSTREFLVTASTSFVWGPAGGNERDFCCVVVNDSVYTDTIRMLDPKRNSTSFGVYSLNACEDYINAHHVKDDFPVLEFDPKKGKMIYKYLVYVDNGSNECYQVKGSFIFRNGHFTQVEETDDMPKEEN